VKKAKTHYTNYRNQGVNPHDFSRNLHREWFELIQFPTSREIESLDTSHHDVSMAKTTKCHGCQEHFRDHDECLAHLATHKACQTEIKILGKTFCFVCDRSYEKEKQAETHYRNSMYNGHQLHRLHHRQYFDYIRDRKVPGRPPRNGSFNDSRPSLEFPNSTLDAINTSLTNLTGTLNNSINGCLNGSLNGSAMNGSLSGSINGTDYGNLLGISSLSNANQTETGSFDCLICKEKFNNEMSRFNHFSNENNQCSLTLPVLFRTICLICQKDLETEAKLSSHLRLNKNEWHKKYYEMFYRKRPGKRSSVMDDSNEQIAKRLIPNMLSLLPPPTTSNLKS
jgi:hypothetical protein